MGSRNYALDGGADWRQLVHTIERYARGCDPALCQISLTICSVLVDCRELSWLSVSFLV